MNSEPNDDRSESGTTLAPGDRIAAIALSFLKPPTFSGGSWTLAPLDLADALISAFPVLAAEPTTTVSRAGDELINAREIELANIYETELEWFDTQDWDGINRSEYNSVLARHLAMHVEVACSSGVATHNTEPISASETMITWNDGHGAVIAVWSPDFKSWTVTGDDEPLADIDWIVARYPKAASFRVLHDFNTPSREQIAFILWCANEGYLLAEDRAGMTNWFLTGSVETDGPGDNRIGWLELADAVLALLVPTSKPGGDS